MRIHQLECPNCGAPLEIKGEASFCFCSYCGKRVVLNEKYAAHRLAERIMGLIEPVEKHNSLKLRLLSANNEEQKLVRAFNQITSIKTNGRDYYWLFIAYFCDGCVYRNSWWSK